MLKPRLSWVLVPGDPAGRGLRQSAYRVPAASSEELLRAGKGDLWDSNAPGVRFLRSEGGAAVYEVGSGVYSFVGQAAALRP